ncbi:MAG: hypothetical protein O3A00_02305 [Planctomycetota bacterium]|nr:hypothetical protein [Planctomycetota bacterium]
MNSVTPIRAGVSVSNFSINNSRSQFAGAQRRTRVRSVAGHVDSKLERNAESVPQDEDKQAEEFKRSTDSLA